MHSHSCDSFGLKHECPLIPNRTNNTGWFFQLLTWPFLYWTFFTRLLFVLVPWFYGFINPYAISKRIWVLFWLVFAFTWAIYSSLIFYVTHHITKSKWNKITGLNDAQVNAIAKLDKQVPSPENNIRVCCLPLMFLTFLVFSKAAAPFCAVASHKTLPQLENGQCKWCQ